MATAKEELKEPGRPTEPTIPGAFPEPVEAVLSDQQTLTQCVYARRSEYTTPQRIRIKIGSWNVGNHDCTTDIAAWFPVAKAVDNRSPKAASSAEHGGGDGIAQLPDLDANAQGPQEESPQSNVDAVVPGEEDIDMFVLGLQEIVDVSSPTEALRPYTDPTAANNYKDSVRACLPPGYTLIAEQQLIGLLILIYVSSKVFADVKSATTTSVGTGLMGYMGNKGAVVTHIILGEATRLVFVNCHLSAGADKAALERRNWDAAQISSRTRFDKIEDPSGVAVHGGEGLGDEDFAFWFGDLNYRIVTLPGDDVRRLLALHTRNEHDLKISAQKSEEAGIEAGNALDTDVESASDADAVSIWSETKIRGSDSRKVDDDDDDPEILDPSSLQTTLNSLLPHDELSLQIKQRVAFHEGWKEGPIRFLPTYKYDVGTVAIFDSSDKKRGPSWCDRILYRTRNDYSAFQQRVKQEEEAKLRDEQMKERGIEEDENVIFDYDPEDDGDDFFQVSESQLENAISRDGDASDLRLEHYDSHQHVLSSDHKPLDAIFSLTYQATVPELKSKVYAEVVRELDRKENEGRPTVTVVIDKPIKDGDTPYHGDDSDDAISFGPVTYKQKKHVNAIIANTGQVSATFSFIDRPIAVLGEEGPSPSWLTIQFDRDPDLKDRKSKSKDGPTYTLEPGDVCNVDLSILIDNLDALQNLNDGVMKLDDVLILRVQNGRDHFLPVQGRWVRSSVDKSLDKPKEVAEKGTRTQQQQKPTSPYSGIFAAFRGSEA